MLHRTVCIASLFLTTALVARAQVTSTQGQEPCRGRKCSKFLSTDHGSGVPAKYSNSKTESWDFKPGEGPVSCAVVNYDVSSENPVLHLLCPEPQVYAPLRVHLALSWTEPGEIPKNIKNMVVDANSLAQFRSTPGNARVEVWVHAAQQTQSRKESVKFTKCKISLVLPPSSEK
jgi:hypothetical protein